MRINLLNFKMRKSFQKLEGKVWLITPFFFVFFFELRVFGQELKVLDHIEPPLEAGESFGSSFDLQGQFLFIGAGGEDLILSPGDTLENAGAVYLYRRQGPRDWQLIRKITAQEPLAFSRFGSTVRVSGNNLFISATQQFQPDGEDGPGLVYTFEKNGRGPWRQKQILSGSDSDPGDTFGFSLAAQGNRLFVGAPSLTSTVEPFIGTVYIFEKNDENKWVEVTTLQADDREPGDTFGGSIASDRNTVFISPLLDNSDPEFQSAGKTYVFRRNRRGNWRQTQVLTASDRKAFADFGSGIVLQGNDAFISARLDSEFGQDTTAFIGAVYVFRRNPQTGRWREVQKITPSQRIADRGFGRSLVVEDNVMLVGAVVRFSNRDTPPGRIFFFEKKNGIREESGSFLPETTPENSEFARRLVFKNGLLVSNAPFGEVAGPVFVYRYVDDINENRSSTTLGNNQNILLYPAIAQAKITIVADTSMERIQVTSLHSGRIVETFEGPFSEKAELDITFLERGVYLLNVYDSKGDKTQHRFIKQ